MTHKIKKADLEIARQIQMVVFDFDGVFTDNRVLVMQEGTEGVFLQQGRWFWPGCITKCRGSIIDNFQCYRGYKDISAKVVNMPWLNRVNREWLEDVAGECDYPFYNG